MGRILDFKNPNRMMFVESESRLYKLKGIAPLPEVEEKDANLKRIGNDGRILLRYLSFPAYRMLAAMEFSAGRLKYDDEIRNQPATEPEAPSQENDTTEPEPEEDDTEIDVAALALGLEEGAGVETFVEDDSEAVEMPPVQDKPRRRSAKKKTGGNKK